MAALDELPATPSEGGRDVAERRAFERAHERHFGGDAAGALPLWDGYLRRYPNGRFVPEARFNRAVCLLRLGRMSEARRALRPIAGSPSSPRREDASRLLRALDDGRIRR